MRTFPARYPGRCAACQERIIEGDQIGYTEDDEIVHADCEASAPRETPPRETCPRCFMERSVSGACGCDE